MMRISNRCASITESATLAIDAKAKALVAQGQDVIGFGVGEPDFDTPLFIRDAAKAALDKGITRYTPAQGTLDLRRAICEKLQAQNGLTYDPTQIVVSNGAKHSLSNIFQALLNPGDEVIIPSPCWVSYPEMVTISEGVPVLVSAGEDKGFKAQASDVEPFITQKTRAIVLNSPNNPNGFVYTREELEGFAALCKQHDIVIISDEVYEHFIYDGQEHISIASLSEDAYQRTVVVNGFSKTFAMTGWRIGYTASCKQLASAMGNLQSHSASNPNSIAQYACIAALNGGDASVQQMVGEFAKRRQLIVDKIRAISGLSCLSPDGAFYVMMNVQGIVGKKYNGQKISGSMDFASYLLEDQGVAVVPGLPFGSDIHCRLSYATSYDAIERGLTRVGQFVSKLT